MFFESTDIISRELIVRAKLMDKIQEKFRIHPKVKTLGVQKRRYQAFHQVKGVISREGGGGSESFSQTI